MKIAVLAVVAAGFVAPGARAQGFLPSPPTLIMYAQVGTGGVSHVALACVDAGGGQPFLPWSCLPHGGNPQWQVRRCDNDPCEFEFPLVLDSETKVHFNSSQPGTYYVTYWNGLSGANSRGAMAVLQRGPIEFPPPIQP